MFGYIVPDKPNLLLKEYALYRAHYCGICKATGKRYGQFPRFATNYDITFFSLFLHDYLALPVETAEGRCIANPVGRKKLIVQTNALLERILAINLIMSYRNLKDDVLDGEGLKKITVAALLRRAYKKAAALLPDADQIVTQKYHALLTLEKEKCDSIDRVADCFAEMLADCALVAVEQYPLPVRPAVAAAYKAPAIDIFGEEEANIAGGGKDNGPTVAAVPEPLPEAVPAAADLDPHIANRPEDLHAFFYNLGRWVYLTDALDDLDEDFRDGKYNPYLAAYPNYRDRQQFIGEHEGEISFSLYSSLNRMAQLMTGFRFTQSKNLLHNIVIYGIPKTTKTMLETKEKLTRERM